MASPESYTNGMWAAIIGILISLFLFFLVALPAEEIVHVFETTNVVSEGTAYDLTGNWAGSYDDTIFWMNVLYIVIIMPALLGLSVWFLSAIKTQEYDVVYDEGPVGQPVSIVESQYYRKY